MISELPGLHPFSPSGNVEQSRQPSPRLRQTRQRRSRHFADLRAHRLAALRGVRAHVLHVRSARQNGCGRSFGKAQDRAGPFGKTQGMLF